MTDKADQIANDDRPVVQESEHDGHVELILTDRTVIMDEAVAAALCSDIMRIVSGVDPDDQP